MAAISWRAPITSNKLVAQVPLKWFAAASAMLRMRRELAAYDKQPVTRAAYERYVSAEDEGGFNEQDRRIAMDMVVPVHGNLPDLQVLLTCLSAVDSIRDGSIIFVDDGSADTNITKALSDFVETHHKCRLIEHSEARGFSVAVNAGIRASHGDVLILNTDIRFSPSALSRLARPFSDKVATRTPLTSSGFLCGIGDPRRGWPALFALDEARIDDACARLSRVPSVQIPTGTAFAMALSRSAFDAVGGFDTRALGYGEDTRLCLQLSALGYRHELALDTYIAHRGGGSFGESRTWRIRKASFGILRDHLDFPRRIHDYLDDLAAKSVSLAVLLMLSKQEDLKITAVRTDLSQIKFNFLGSSLTMPVDFDAALSR